MNQAFINKLNSLVQQVPELVRRLPGIVKVEGLRFISDNFEKEGFEDKPGSWTPWKKKEKKGAAKKTLMGEKRGGSLRRSWQQQTGISGTAVEFTSQLPYAGVHNEGLQAGRPPGFTMPQRQMIGDSAGLDARVEQKFDREFDKLFKASP